jgi:LPXTG-site transpeptidase (sortase) family protein
MEAAPPQTEPTMIEKLRTRIQSALQALRTMDRRIAAAGGVLVASVLLLVIGLLSIVIALNDGGADLPNEGSIDDILAERVPGQSFQVNDVHSGPPPVRLTIPELSINAPVVAMGLDSRNYPQVPRSGGDVAWYSFSAAPGHGSNAVFSGHVDWYYGDTPGQGVFYRLRELQIGDLIGVEVEDGTRLTYRVTGNVAVPYDDPNVVEVMDPTSNDVVTLITCGGTWAQDYSNPNGGNYSHRVVVRAERVLDLAQAQDP